MILGKAARFALYALVLMARDPSRRWSATAIAAAFDISEAHVAKVLQQLVRARLVQGVRGPGGGYELLRDPADITMFDVVQRFEDRSAGDDPQALGSAARRVHAVLAELDSHVYYTLKSVTIATLAGSDDLQSVA